MRIWFSTLIFLLILTGCSRQRAARFYFHKVTAYDKKVGSLRTRYEIKIREAIDDRIMNAEFGKAESLRKEFVQKFTRLIGEINLIEPFHGDTELRNSTMEFMMAIREYWEIEEKEIISRLSHIPPLTTEDSLTINAQQRHIDSVNTRILRTFQEAQYRFAEKFRFAIIKPGEQ